MATPSTPPTHGGHRRLQRSSEGRILGGVASGLARHFDVGVGAVRVGFVALCLFGGMAVPLYVAAWLLLPEEGADSTVVADLLGLA
jgi:phage shock protein C